MSTLLEPTSSSATARTRPRPSIRHRRPHAAAERRDPQADDAARGQPGAGEPAEHQVGVPSRARDLSSASTAPAAASSRCRATRRAGSTCRRRSAFARRTPTRRWRPTSRSRSTRAAVRSSSRASVRNRAWRRWRRAPTARRAAAGAARLRRRRPHVYLRAGAAVAAMPGRARSRARLPQRSQLRPLDEVLRRRRIDARAGAQDAVADRGRPPAPGERERPAARRAARALRLLAHPRHQRRDAPGLRAGGAGGADQHDGAHPRRVGHRQGADRAGHPLQLAARARRRSSR